MRLTVGRLRQSRFKALGRVICLTGITYISRAVRWAKGELGSVGYAFLYNEQEKPLDRITGFTRCIEEQSFSSCKSCQSLWALDRSG